MTQITAADGHCFSSYRADPSGPPLGAVVVVSDLPGLDPHVRAVVDDFAAKGYVAIAPALFGRIQPEPELNPDPAAQAEAEAEAEAADLAEQLRIEQALVDVQATVDTVKPAGKVAVVGFSWGGYLAFLAANEIPGLACAVAYYGSGIVDVPRVKRRIPTLLHFADNDPSAPPEAVKQFRANRPDVSVFTYTVSPGFDCSPSAAFDEEAAQSANARTLFWVGQFVVGQAPILLKNAGAYAAAKVDKKKAKAPVGDDLGPPLD